MAASAAFAVGALLLAACGGGSSSGGGSNQGLTSRGPITYVAGKDNNNVNRPTIDKWNAAHPNEKVTFKEQSDQADQQHDDLVQHFQAKDANYDVVSVDVIWTAEFAAKGWLQPLKGDFAVDTSKFLPATVKTATYNNTLYALPYASDGGLLYYRKDLVPTPPKTWDEMMSDCSIAKKNHIDCYAGQFAKYEGLTVNAAEAINTAGGQIVGADCKTLTVGSPQSAQGVEPWWPRRRHQHLLRAQGHRLGLHQVLDERGDGAVLRDPGLPGAGHRVPLRRPDPDPEAAVPADAEDVHRERRSPPRDALLPGGDQGGGGQRLRRDQG